MKHKEIILFPGLGDDNTVRKQERYESWLNRHRPETAQIFIFDTRWQTDESFDEKRKRALTFINEHPNAQLGYGISAGASLLMSLSKELPDNFRYVFVSGKLHHPHSIGPAFSKRAPAIYDSVVTSEKAITSPDFNAEYMTCYAGYLDGVLSQEDMRIPGVAFKRIPLINHTITISAAYAMLLPRL